MDLLASQYGGGPNEILETVSLYSLICLSDKIEERQIKEWRMQAVIVSYPHMEKKHRKKFMDELDAIAKKKRQGLQP